MDIHQPRFTRKKMLYLVYLFVFTIIASEIILRVYYPFPHHIVGHSWKMATNVTYRLNNHFNTRLDSVVINRRNAIGFRGENPLPDMQSALTILTVGGSTTACTFLSEGNTWSDL